ncbi:MarR family winged helix-turn-helix transcriptional regulator [Methyloligella solikamskensis]|uniref:MarR family winged helix-turn-helix transcriptional regulator n=1 Tax=Methyloligella solikamskensis TaxID=1177756 RepID=A0ABW3JCU9_9HYPH
MSINSSTGRQAVTALVLDLFRLNSRLLIAGDRLVEGLGLTSARWQILGAIAEAETPRPVAWLARDMGGARQNVQRIVNDLSREGLVSFVPNPHHKRAQLVVMTERGRETYDAAVDLWEPMTDELMDGLSVKEIEEAHRVLLRLRENIEKREE